MVRWAFYECYAFKSSHRNIYPPGQISQPFQYFFLKRKLIEITIYGRSMKIFVSELTTPWRSAVVGLALCLIEFSYFGFVPYLGQEFVLTFHFDDSEFLVYSDDENRCFQYRFEYKFDIRDIKSVQVWDDIDYVDEIIFRYKKNQ